MSKCKVFDILSEFFYSKIEVTAIIGFAKKYILHVVVLQLAITENDNCLKMILKAGT